SGWAADLLERAATPTEAVTQPDGFRGELRSYQAEAVAWLGFLDDVGLGGCLALDMGLGKTPTVLAHLARTKGSGRALVIALRALNGILVFRRTKTEPEVAAELPDRIDELDHCTMTPEQIGLYQAVLDNLVAQTSEAAADRKQGAILAAITALKQICNHPAA